LHGPLGKPTGQPIRALLAASPSRSSIAAKQGSRISCRAAETGQTGRVRPHREKDGQQTEIGQVQAAVQTGEDRGVRAGRLSGKIRQIWATDKLFGQPVIIGQEREKSDFLEKP